MCHFDTIYCRYNGGAIAVSGGRVVIEDCHFRKNQAGSGGCVAAGSMIGPGKDYGKVTVIVNRSTFVNNSLLRVSGGFRTRGGAVMALRGRQASAEISYSSFTHNWWLYVL